MAGAVVLAVALLLLREGLGALVPADRYAAWIVVPGLVVFGAGDVWASIRNRLHPVGLRRQTQKILMYRGYSPRQIGFIWGFDAGLGVTTYRVTSGVWLLAALVVLDVASPWLTLVYAAGFVGALLAITSWPVRTAGRDPSDVRTGRVLGLARHRRLAQLAYVVLAPLALITALG